MSTLGTPHLGQRRSARYVTHKLALRCRLHTPSRFVCDAVATLAVLHHWWAEQNCRCHCSWYLRRFWRLITNAGERRCVDSAAIIPQSSWQWISVDCYCLRCLYWRHQWLRRYVLGTHSCPQIPLAGQYVYFAVEARKF